MKEAKQRAFLAALAETGHIRNACRAAGVGKSTVYGWIKEDQRYAEAVDDARAAAFMDLEDEARRRAIEGTRTPLYDKSGYPLRDPDTCECSHDRRQWHLKGGPCTAPGCDCQAFIGEPAYQIAYSDRLLEILLRANISRYRNRTEVEISSPEMKRLIDRMDQWPDEYISRATTEPIELVINSMKSDVIRGLLAEPIDDAEVVEDGDTEDVQTNGEED